MIVHVLCFLVGGSANGKREQRRRRGGRERREGEEKKKGRKVRREEQTKVIKLMYMHSHMRPLNLHGMAV